MRFYIEPRIRFYTRTWKFKHDVINRRGKKGSLFNLKKNFILNGLTLCIYTFGEKGPFLNLKKSCIINGLTRVSVVWRG